MLAIPVLCLLISTPRELPSQPPADAQILGQDVTATLAQLRQTFRTVGVAVGQEAKELGLAVGLAAKEGGLAVGHGAKQAGVAAGHGAVAAGHSVKRTMKKLGQVVQEAVP
jgi:hypothetical protein